jgi:chromosome segregation ATPase
MASESSLKVWDEVVNARSRQNDYEDIRDRLRNLPTYKEQLKAQVSLCGRVLNELCKERIAYFNSAEDKAKTSEEYRSKASEMDEEIDKAKREKEYMQGKYEEACDQFTAVLAEAAMLTALLGGTPVE